MCRLLSARKGVWFCCCFNVVRSQRLVPEQPRPGQSQKGSPRKRQVRTRKCLVLVALIHALCFCDSVLGRVRTLFRINDFRQDRSFTLASRLSNPSNLNRQISRPPSPTLDHPRPPHPPFSSASNTHSLLCFPNTARPACPRIIFGPPRPDATTSGEPQFTVSHASCITTSSVGRRSFDDLPHHLLQYRADRGAMSTSTITSMHYTLNRAACSGRQAFN